MRRDSARRGGQVVMDKRCDGPEWPRIWKENFVHVSGSHLGIKLMSLSKIMNISG
jgi:hypothetical protein